MSLLVAASIATPVLADPIKQDEYYSNHSMGCMLLRECTDGVKQINSIADVADTYPDSNFSSVANEFNSMLIALNQVGVNVFLAEEKYFPVGHRGVYHTVSNNFFLNKTFIKRPHVLMSVMRHEGWHAAQDCMAHAIPWEKEATWAGKTQGMTMKALQSCAAGTMWSDYEPTPMTREWLVENGYLSK